MSAEQLKLGQIITDAQERDAIHVAVSPMVAGQTLAPGDHVAIRNGKAYRSQIAEVGVVDPFLRQGVRNGQRFWLFLYPGSITSLRHDWTHPAFAKAAPQDSNPDRESAMAWIQEYAKSIGVDPGKLIAGADAFLESGDYFYGDDDYDSPARFSGGEYLNEEFWDHYEVVSGKRVPSRQRESFFSCSC